MNLRRSFLALAAVVAAMLATPHASLAQEPLRGVALVIGNGKYRHLAGLDNPDRDARAVEELFDRLGFETDLSSDLDARRLTRDLDDFVEDAEGADVAVLYYAGHGIEAGGENWLVPVDADVSAPGNAEDALVPLSRVLARLRSTVAVTIVLLDACRDNPFPPGATLRLASGQSAAISAAGLAAADGRGATGMAPTAASGTAALGIVVGFAAEPGKVALDGTPGTNSPYAAALVRHLSAMAGAEFGQVMRMVGEEVYLKTAGRQRPWVNESLRRLLYFGEAPAAPAGDEGDILAERRRLLLTIADLPDLRRLQVERAASQGGVPMDALYGLLAAMGADIPDDPASLEEMLRGEAQRFAKILAERETISSPDSEIVRLSALADAAEREGLLAKAGELRERAKARFRDIEPTLEAQQAALAQRFIEGAAVFARSAETKTFAFDRLGAARDYAEAFRRVEGRDDRLAWIYKASEATALARHGADKGDPAVLEEALSTGFEALRLAERLGDLESWATSQDDIGLVQLRLGMLLGDGQRLEQTVGVYRALIRDVGREHAPTQWARLQNNLASTLYALGELESEVSRFREAIRAYDASLEVYTRQDATQIWAETQVNIGNTLLRIYERTADAGAMDEAIGRFRTALEVIVRGENPFEWAATQIGLGAALVQKGRRGTDKAQLVEGATAFRAALLELSREHTPRHWATARANLGIALWALGDRTEDIETLLAAVEALRDALREHRPGEPAWAQAQNVLGIALHALGRRDDGAGHLDASVAAFRTLLAHTGRGTMPFQWATAQVNLGNVLATLGKNSRDAGRLAEAAAAYRSALDELTRETTPQQWAAAMGGLSDALVARGGLSGSRSEIEEGRQTLAALRDFDRSGGHAFNAEDHYRDRLAAADAALAQLP